MNSLGKILKLMLERQGHIMAQGRTSEIYIIVPRGDRRLRPIGWVDLSQLQQLCASGAICKKGRAYILCESYVKRSRAGVRHGRNNAYANQHRDLEKRDIYHPDGIKRPVRINQNHSVFRKLAKATNKDGSDFLQSDEIEAGEMFVADYGRSMMAGMASQNYQSMTSVDKGKENTAENISISAMDSRKRVLDALAMVGSGLDRALVSLCVGDWSLRQLEESEQWANGSGRTILKLALSRLSEFYGCKPGISARRRPSL